MTKRRAEATGSRRDLIYLSWNASNTTVTQTRGRGVGFPATRLRLAHAAEMIPLLCRGSRVYMPLSSPVFRAVSLLPFLRARERVGFDRNRMTRRARLAFSPPARPSVAFQYLHIERRHVPFLPSQNAVNRSVCETRVV